MKKYPNLYQRGSAWYYRFKMHGRSTPFRGSCYTTDVREAQRVLRDKMAEAEAAPTATTVAKTRHMTVAAMAAWDCERALHKRSSKAVVDSTLVIYWRRLSETFTHAGEFTADSLNAYARRRLSDGMSAQTVKRDLWAAKRGYDHALETDPSLPPLRKLMPLGVDDPGKAQGQNVALPVLEQWLGLLARTSRAQALIALATGIRSEELKRYDPTWLVQKGEHAFISLPRGSTKGRKARSIGLHPLVAKLLIRYAPFEANPRKAWATAAKSVGLTKPISMRDLRTTFASNVSRYDADGIRLVMGHTTGDRNAAMYYQHASEERLVQVAESTLKAFPFLRRLCTELLRR